MRNIIVVSLCFSLTSCGLIQAKTYCNSSTAKQAVAYDLIDSGAYTIDSAYANIKSKGSPGPNWEFFFATIRENPSITWADLKIKSLAFCNEDYFKPEPVVRTKDEQYCYESSMACYPHQVSCENACNTQMRAVRNYQR